MLRLTLVRHAKAEPAQTGQEDWERVLDATGQREAVHMGQRLQRRNMQPACLASSTAVRAVSTAQLLAHELSYPRHAIVADERLYLISAPDLLDWICEQERTAEHLMIVAHNPGLSDFAARITAEPTVDALSTGASYTLLFAIEHWRELTWASGEEAELHTP
jgi:phosphohistidine phosphatase